MSTGGWVFCTIVVGFTIWALMDTIKRIRWKMRKKKELALPRQKKHQVKKDMDISSKD
jgi:hypothetical protein